MRRAKQEIIAKEALEEILSNSIVCRIAMVDENNIPYIVPYNYGYKDNYIYIHSAHVGKKIDILKNNNNVCFEIEQKADIISADIPCAWSAYYRSVIGYGKIELIEEFEEKKKALEIIMHHYGAKGDMAFEEIHINTITIQKLKIDKITGKQSRNWNRIICSNQFELDTDRLYIKEINWNDLDKIHELHSIPEVDEFNTLGIPKDIEETKDIVKSIIDAQIEYPRKSYQWKIVLKETGEFIGMCGLFPSLDKFKLGEIYYKLNPAYWGNGYATEVAKRLIKLGFEDFKLHKVEAGVETSNAKSIRILEKCGMTREGLRKKILPIRGQWKDNYHYAIVEDEWK